MKKRDKVRCSVMKKILIFVCLLLGFAWSAPIMVNAQADDIATLTEEIASLEASLKEKRAELKVLRANTEGLYTLETTNATLVFSNLRIEDNRLLIDLDYTNDSKGPLDIYNEMWMITFAREDERTIKQLWLDSERAFEVEGRETFLNNIRLKSGATIPLTLALTENAYYYYAEYAMENYPTDEMMEAEDLEETSGEAVEEETSVKEPIIEDTESPLIIRIDAYYTPSGLSEEIVVPFAQ